MKLLWLGSSNDARDFLPEERRAPSLLADSLGKSLDTPIDVVVRGIWPTETLPSLVESWVDTHQPDLVLLKVLPYWFCYESVPLKLERKLGWFGKPLAGAGLKAADTRWLASTPLFHAGRKLVQRTVGGAAAFEPEEVLERMSACIRIILRSEGTALFVRGPRGASDYHVDRRAALRAEVRRLSVHRPLRDLCEELHVRYLGSDEPRHESHTASRLGDRLHYDASEQEVEAADLSPYLLQAWEQQHP